MICLLLPWPVSVNSAYRNLPGHGRVKTKAYKRWEAEAADWVRMRSDMRNGLVLAEPLSSRIRLELRMHEPDRRRRDISNFIKVPEDYLKSIGVYLDDSQVDKLVVERDRVSSSKGTVLVTVEEL